MVKELEEELKEESKVIEGQIVGIMLEEGDVEVIEEVDVEEIEGVVAIGKEVVQLIERKELCLTMKNWTMNLWHFKLSKG